MKCDRVRQDMKAYVDGELGVVSGIRVARHIARCPECRMEEIAMTELTKEVRKSSGEPAPARLRETVLGRIEFKPSTAGRTKSRFIPSLEAALGLLVLLVVVSAVVTPVTHRARESARKVSARNNMKELGQALVLMPQAKMRRKSADTAGNVAFEPLAPSSEPLIIKTAELQLQVKNFQKASDQAVFIAKSVAGYVTDSSASAEETSPTSGTMTLRVPVDSFERVMVRLSSLGVVKSRSINGKDVTGTVVDLESRLRNKRAEERQYLEIMNRAKRISDIVTVTNELSRVRGEIEEDAGRLKSLKSSAVMSTVSLSMSEKEQPKPKPQSSLHNTFTNAMASMGRTLNALASLLIWLGVYSPFWVLPIGAIVYLRRRSATSRQS